MRGPSPPLSIFRVPAPWCQRRRDYPNTDVHFPGDQRAAALVTLREDLEQYARPPRGGLAACGASFVRVASVGLSPGCGVPGAWSDLVVCDEIPIVVRSRCLVGSSKTAHRAGRAGDVSLSISVRAWGILRGQAIMASASSALCCSVFREASHQLGDMNRRCTPRSSPVHVA